jgi:serine/threonine-protein kinase
VKSLITYSPLPNKNASQLARGYAEIAIGLDDSLCESHAALGVVLHRYEWNWAAAEREYRRAIELNPDYAQTYYWYSNLLATTGRTDEALAQSLKFRELDPFSPVADVNIGRVYYYSDRNDKAYEQLTETLKKSPNNLRAEYFLGLVYLQKGNYDEALKIFEKIYASDKKIWTAAVLGFTYGKMGRQADARKLLSDLEEYERKNAYVPPQEKAIIYLGLNDKDNAIFWLEKSYEEKSSALVAINVDPLFKDLRSDKRFQDLVSRMNLKLN